LICGHNTGTFVIEKNNVAHKISEVTGGWCTVQAPGNPGILIQSTYTGLIVFNKDAAGRWQFSQRIKGFVEPLKKAVFDTRGDLWGVHPNRGLFRLRLSDDWSKVVESRIYAREDKLPSDFKLGLARIGNDIVVNTDPGPCRIERSGDQISFFPLTDSARRQKWLSGVGVDYFILDSNVIRLVTRNNKVDLLLSLVPGFENIVALRPDVYLFCLENGFALLEQQQQGLQRNAISAQPVIRQIGAGDGALFLPAEDGRMHFNWGQNSLLFRFAAPYFERAPKFSWKLEGFSDQWSVWQSAPEKEFTSLPSGNYTFRVRTDAGGGEAVVLFRIAPPWYLSGWAALAYCLLAAAVFWAIEVFNRRRLQNQRLRLEAEKEHEILVLEIENKSRELSNAALNLIRKNEALQSLKDDLLESRNEPRSIQKIVRRIDAHLEADHDWEIFEASFNQVHDDFFKRLMQDYPDLTPGDLRLAAYLKMNLSSKEIAPLLNISIRGVENKRYRLRKKTGLPEDANLTEFMMRF
jgi:DNA-binding CsgD family transcriptional regulator